MPPGAQQGLLERVLGVKRRAKHPVAVEMELARIGLREPAEGVLVTGLGGGDELGIGDPHHR
jgi:hypothetical protein